MAEAEIALNQQAIQKLAGYYKTATSNIIARLTKLTSFEQARQLEVLAQIDQILQELDQKTAETITGELEAHYTKYAKQTATVAKQSGLQLNPTLTALDRQAIEALANGTMETYREAYSGVKRAAMRMLTEAHRQEVQATLIEGRITGATRKAIADSIAGQLKEGLVTLIDKGGRKWSLEAYSNMLTRTMFVKSANDGIINKLLAGGEDLVQVSYHGADCKLCQPWEGKILSISGLNPVYPSKAEAEDNGLMHPNCRHRYLPYRETLAQVSTVWNPDTKHYIQL